MKNNLVFVAGLHGNEPVPVMALAAHNIPYVCGNSLALKLGVRFVDQDLNASFGVTNETHESQQAQNVLQNIPENAIVIDLHTMPVDSPSFAIVVDEHMIPFAKTLGVMHIVYMKYNPKNGHALINHRDGVSIETGTHGSYDAFLKTLEVVQCAQGGSTHTSATIYEVYGAITKKGMQKNFELYEDKGESYYPVLAGDRTYNFLGLKARIYKGEIQ